MTLDVHHLGQWETPYRVDGASDEVFVSLDVEAILAEDLAQA